MWFRPTENVKSLDAFRPPRTCWVKDPYESQDTFWYSTVVLPRKEETYMFDKASHIPMVQFCGAGKSQYSDYEELAFMDGTVPWVQQLFGAVKDIGKAFARDCQGYQTTTAEQVQDYMDTVFYCSVHILHSYNEAKDLDERESQLVNDVVEAVCFTMQTLMSNDYLVRSSIDWSDPQAYQKYLTENKE